MGLNEHGESVVVVPSVTIDRVGEGSGSLMQAYEERFLFLLLLLQEPRLRMVYVTSTPIAPSIIEYYLALLPAVIPSHARARLSLVAVQDGSPRPLTAKLLERPAWLSISAHSSRTGAEPTSSLTTPRRSNGTSRLLWGSLCTAPTRNSSISGRKRLPPDLRRGGCAPPDRPRDLHGFDEVVDALARLRAASTGADEVLVKLNEGVSGGGNALVDLRGLPPRARPMSYRSCASVPGPCGSSALTCHSTPMSPSSLNAVASSRSE